MGQPLIAGRYQAGAVLGAGSAGTVYSGIDTLSGEKVAIKALRSEVVETVPELLDRFLREGEALRRLDHPNIVKVLAVIQETDQHYIIMEYVPGGSLASHIASKAQLPVEQIIKLGIELSDALARAHYLEIIHRDVKPANILLDIDGSPRLTDFGLAWVSGSPAITASGSVLGTFPYMSPEACSNQPLDARSDIWSLGVVLFEALSGCLPFAGNSPFEIIWSIKNDPLPSLESFRSDVPPALLGLIGRMLMKDKAARVSGARQLGAELEVIQKKLKDPRQQALLPVQRAVPVQEPVAQKPVSTGKIRVLIVDDHAVVRQGLRTFIDLQNDMEVIGEGSDGREAVSLSRTFQPDIVLLDLVMPEMDGIEATRGILDCSPRSRVIILTSFGEDEKVFPAIRAGAQGYLLKDIRPTDLVQAVRDAHAGKTQLHPDIARKLMMLAAGGAATAEAQPGAAKLPAAGGEENLTERELEVLQFIASGLTNHEIAERMVISETTVKTHVSHILGKLDLEDRTQAAIWALKHGLGPQA
jgi:DNA-binding NarL/FixJ family response regulator